MELKNKTLSFIYYALLLIIMPLLLSRNTIDPVNIKLYFAEVITAFYFAYLIVTHSIKKNKIQITVMTILFTVFAIWEIIGHFFPVIKQSSGERFRLILLGVGIFSITALDNKFIIENRITLTFFSLASALLVSFITFFPVIYPFKMHYEYIYVLPSGTFGGHNLLSTYLLINTGLLFSILKKPKQINLKKAAYYSILGAIYLIFALAMYISKSRSGIVSFAIISFLFTVSMLLLHPKIKTAWVATFIILFVLLSSTGFFININFSKTVLNNVKYSLINKRIPLWKSAFNMGKKHPIIGWGSGSFRSVFPAYKSDNLKTMYFEPVKDWQETGAKCAVIAHAHNEFLQIFCDRGVIGLILFVLLLICLFVKSIKSIMADKNNVWQIGLLLAIFGILFQNIFTVTMRYPSSFIFVILFLGILANSDRKNFLTFKNYIPKQVAIPLIIVFLLISLKTTFYNFMADINLQRSLVLLNSKNPQEAMECIERSKKYNNKNPDVYYKEGYTAFLMHDYNRSSKAFLKILSLEPNFSHAHYNLGCSFYKLNKIKEAKIEFLRSLKLFPNNVSTLHYLANISFLQKDYAGAYKYSGKVVAMGEGSTAMKKLYDELKKNGINL